MRERVIGVDAGGTMTKAALFDGAGHELACERRPNIMLFPKPGHTERDPERMAHAMAEAVKALLDSTGTDPSDIAAISTSGYGGGLYVVDSDCKPVRPGIVSTDSRTTPLIDEWTRDGRVARNEPRIQQRMWPSQSTVLMAWMQRHEPEVMRPDNRIMLCKDFLRAKLSGDCSTDPTDGGIAGFIDVNTSSYAEEMLDDLGLGPCRAMLPEIKPSVDVAGRVTADAARATGLREGTPVVRGVVDVVGSSIASGVTQPSQLSMVAGTFSINSTLHTTPRMSVVPFLQMPYPIAGKALATEGAATSASNFEWFCRTILDGEAARALAGGRSIYDVCNDFIGDALARDTDIFFFPYLFGGPAGAPAGFIGLHASHVLGDLLTAIFEGVAFAHRDDIERLLSGPDAARVTSIRLAGGASRSRLWAQMFADVLGLPVEVTDGTELGARGAAIASAVAVGLHPDVETAVRNMVRVAARFEPRADRHTYYTAKYRRFVALTRTLAEASGKAA